MRNKIANFLLFPILVSCSNNPVTFSHHSEPFKLYEYNVQQTKSGFADTLFLNSFANLAFNSIKNNYDTNFFFSPASLFMNNSVVAEVSSSNGKFLSATGIKTLENLRKINKYVLDNNEEKITNSVWIDDNFDVYQDPVFTLGNNYYVNVFQMDFSEDNNLNYLASWCSERTNNILNVSYQDLGLTKNTSLSFVNTLTVMDEWKNEPNVISSHPFYLSLNDSINCEYLEFKTDYFYQNSVYQTAKISLKNTSLDVYLPNEGMSIDNILSSDYLNHLTTYEDDESNYATVYLPKFDVYNRLDVTDFCKDTLGLSYVDKLTNTPIDLERIMQINRFNLNECGIHAATITVSHGYGAYPDKENEIILDFNKPFVYVLRDVDNIPLYIGVINNPINE